MRRILLAILALCAVEFIASKALAVPTVRTVALLGQQAPGTQAGVLYSAFGERPPAINNLGQVAFRGFVAGGGADNTNAIGIWSEANGALELVARSGSQVPGLPAGVTYFDIGYPFISDDGTTAAQGFFQGSGINSGNDQGYITSSAGTTNILAREGDQSPGMPSGVTFGQRGEPLLNGEGRLVFYISITASGGIWSNVSGTLGPVALAYTQAPGLPIGTNFGASFNYAQGGFNSAGQIVFTNRLAPRDASGIWSTEGGNTSLVAVSGRQAVGFPIGTNLLAPGGLSLNSLGQIAYIGRVFDNDTDPFNDYGVWLFDNGSTELIVRSGGQAPGMPAGATYQYLSAALSEHRQMLLQGTVAGPGVTSDNNAAIWKRDTAGSIHLLAREGDQAVGLPTGYTYGETGPSLTQIFTNRAINAMGNIAFQLQYASTPSGPTGRSGIWAEDIYGDLQLIAAVGFPLEIAPGDTRIVRDLFFHGSGNNESGQRSGFNDRGQVAFWARFTDDSAGIFVSNLVAIPEPGTLAFMGIPALVILLRRR